jgi:hypothetical protein
MKKFYVLLVLMFFLLVSCESNNVKFGRKLFKASCNALPVQKYEILDENYMELDDGDAVKWTVKLKMTRNDGSEVTIPCDFITTKDGITHDGGKFESVSELEPYMD